MPPAVSTLYRVRSLDLQPLSAGNSADYSQADNSKMIQCRARNLTSMDSLGSWESIYVHFKPVKPVEIFTDNRNAIFNFSHSAANMQWSEKRKYRAFNISF